MTGPFSRPTPALDEGSMEERLNGVLYVSSGYMYFFTGELYYRYNWKTDLVRRYQQISVLPRSIIKFKLSPGIYFVILMKFYQQ